ncbi:MAG: hypothetical protein JW987_05015 [Anaerolineaceae bacterium]|nr:hypothetical protein [Anaerolineaceae bacterium]
MDTKYRQMIIILLFGLMFGFFPPVPGFIPQQANAADASTTAAVSITTGGFTPSLVSVNASDSVTWTNQTSSTIDLIGGNPYRMHLPLILRYNSYIASGVFHLPKIINEDHNLIDWLEIEIAPGGTFTHTFTAPGDYPYYAIINGHIFTGKITVEGSNLSYSVLYMPNDIGSASIFNNDSLNLGNGYYDDFTIEMFFYVPDVSYSDTAVDVLARKVNCFQFYISFKADQPDRIYLTLVIPSYGEVLMWHETNLQVGWHHVAAVFDNEYTESEDAFTIFLDGARVAHSPEEGIHMDWVPGLPYSSRDLEIGGVSTQGFHGFLEEARISDIARYTALTYTVPTGPFSPDGNTRALWHFDDVAGSTTFIDASSYGNHLTGYYGAQTYNP